MGKMKRHLNEVVNVCWNYAGRADGKKDEVMNAVLGLAGEAGEVADLHKKYYYHTDKGKDHDAFYKDKLKHELGDVVFYLLKVMDLWDLSLAEVLKANREKLESRHPELGKVVERFGKGYIGG